MTRCNPSGACLGRDTIPVLVVISPDLSAEGVRKAKPAMIDACIADIVRGLSWAGVDMRASCCGHGERAGTITLQDGRVLSIDERRAK